MNKFVKRFTSEEKTQAIQLYNQGMASTKIAKLLNRSWWSVLDNLKRAGVVIRKNHLNKRKYTLNENVFDEINEESAYWIGLLIADGSVRLQRKGINPVISLGLKESDKNHLEKYCNFLQSNRPTYKIKKKNGFYSKSLFYSVSFNSLHVYQTLNKYGIIPNKTLKEKISNNLVLNNNFWRGVIDGDGTIGITKNKKYFYPYIQLVGSMDLMNQFKKFILYHIPDFKGTVRYSKLDSNKNIYFIAIKSQKQVIKLIDTLYKNSTIYLDRKYEKANEILNKFKDIYS